MIKKKNYNEGGLKMLDLSRSLKYTWIQKSVSRRLKPRKAENIF